MKKFVRFFLFLILVSAVIGLNALSEAALASALTNQATVTPVQIVAPETVKIPATTPTTTKTVPEKTSEITPGTTQILEPLDPETIPVLIKDVYLAYPRGGEVFKRGQPIIIEFWVKSTGSYAVLCSRDAGNNWSQLGVVTANGYNAFFPWAASEPGSFRIKVISLSDNSKYDAGDDCTVTTEQWDGQLQAAAGYKNVKLTWKHVACKQGSVSTYDIYRGISPSMKFNLLTKLILINTFPADGAISYTDNDVINGTTYYYKIVPLAGSQDFNGIYKMVSAKPQGTIVLTIGSPFMTVNGETMEIDPGKNTAPVIVNDRVFVPVRTIVEAMGGTVSWDSLTKKITIKYKESTVILQIGSTEAIVNGVSQKMDVAPFVSETGSTMLPVRYVAQYLCCQVDWDAAKQSVIIRYY